MELVYLVAFFYGSLSFISDLISDSNIFVNYKTISEILFSLLTLYFIFYNKFMSFFITSVYSIGGLVSYLFAPHIVDALVWKISIYFSIPVFIYHLFNYKNLLKDLSQDNLKSFFLFVVPAIIFLMLYKELYNCVNFVICGSHSFLTPTEFDAIQSFIKYLYLNPKISSDTFVFIIY